MFCKKVVSITMALALAGMAVISSSAYAQQSPTGKVKAIFMDGGGLSVELHQMEVPGKCGSNMFRIAMTKPGYKELVAMTLAAYLSNKIMSLWVDGCNGTTNNVYGGGSWNP